MQSYFAVLCIWLEHFLILVIIVLAIHFANHADSVFMQVDLWHFTGHLGVLGTQKSDHELCQVPGGALQGKKLLPNIIYALQW